mgnify:FL=1
MIRHGNLFGRTFTPDALYRAFQVAAKGKRNRRACFAFERHLASNLDRLWTALHTRTYQPQPYIRFWVYEPKPRLIYAPAFGDLVVQHALYAVVGPLFDVTLCDQSFACRVGKGTHKAADYAQAALHASAPDRYTLKLDIRRFFYRIDRGVLRGLLERKLKDRRMVDLLMIFAEYGEPVGIPIGNLLSQLYALIYLDPLDRFIKRELKVKRYCRYVDDFILFNLTRPEAEAALARIKAFLAEHLRLELSRYTLARTTRGVNFVGYRTWASKRFIRKHSLFKFGRALRRGDGQAAVSILGHARRTHSRRHLLRIAQQRNADLIPARFYWSAS